MSSFTGIFMSANTSLATSAPRRQAWPICACTPEVGSISATLRLAGADCAEAKRSGSGAPISVGAGGGAAEAAAGEACCWSCEPSLICWPDYRDGRSGRARSAGMTRYARRAQSHGPCGFCGSRRRHFRAGALGGRRRRTRRRPVRDGDRPARGDDGRGAGSAARAASSTSCAAIPTSPARRRAPATSPTIPSASRRASASTALSRGGVRALPSPERRLQGEVRLSLHDLRAPPHARIRSWRSSSAGWRTTRRPSSPRRCRKSSTSRGCGSRRR